MGLLARAAGSVAALLALWEKTVGAGTVGEVTGDLGGDFVGLVAAWGPTTPCFSSVGLKASACLGSILTSYLLSLPRIWNFGLGKEMLLLIDLRRFLVRDL